MLCQAFSICTCQRRPAIRLESEPCSVNVSTAVKVCVAVPSVRLTGNHAYGSGLKQCLRVVSTRARDRDVNVYDHDGVARCTSMG